MSDPRYLQSMIAIWTAAAATTTDLVIYRLFQKLIREAQELMGGGNDQYQPTIEIREQSGI